MASLENRSVSNLIEVMADERWKQTTDFLRETERRLAESDDDATLESMQRMLALQKATPVKKINKFLPRRSIQRRQRQVSQTKAKVMPPSRKR